MYMVIYISISSNIKYLLLFYTNDILNLKPLKVK